MSTRTVDGRTVVWPALGLMSIAGMYGSVSDDQSKRLIVAALEAGATNLDCADVYGGGRAERLVGEVFAERPELRKGVYLASKFGNLFDEATGKPTGEVRGDRQYVLDCVEGSLRRLGTTIDLYYVHRVDPKVPLEETFGTLEMTDDSHELRKAGKIGAIGISECSAATLRKAATICKLSALQVEYSAWATHIERDGTLAAARELGLPTFGYSPIGRGLLAGTFKTAEEATSGPENGRLKHPRFAKEHFDQNLALVHQLSAIAEAKGCTPSQLAIAWVAAQGEDIIPIAGTKNVDRMRENLQSNQITFTADELAKIREIVDGAKPAGLRYPQAMLDKTGH